MHLKSIIMTLGGIGIGLLLARGTTATANTHYLTGVKNHNFFITQRTLNLPKTKYKRALTIPKGTIVQAQGVSKINDKLTTHIYLNTLSYHLRHNYIGHGERSTKSIALTTSNFKKVKVPQYVKYYSTQLTYADNIGVNYTADGNLYAGKQYPKETDLLSAKAARITVTSDGYLEYYANTKVFSTIVDPKPTTSVKITKVTGPADGKTNLYTKQPVPNTIGKRISETGTAQYVTTIKRLYRTYATVTATARDKAETDSIDISAGYQVNGKSYFMYQAIFFPEG